MNRWLKPQTGRRKTSRWARVQLWKKALGNDCYCQRSNCLDAWFFSVNTGQKWLFVSPTWTCLKWLRAFDIQCNGSWWTGESGQAAWPTVSVHRLMRHATRCSLSDLVKHFKYPSFSKARLLVYSRCHVKLESKKVGHVSHVVRKLNFSKDVNVYFCLSKSHLSNPYFQPRYFQISKVRFLMLQATFIYSLCCLCVSLYVIIFGRISWCHSWAWHYSILSQWRPKKSKDGFAGRIRKKFLSSELRLKYEGQITARTNEARTLTQSNRGKLFVSVSR